MTFKVRRRLVFCQRCIVIKAHDFEQSLFVDDIMCKFPEKYKNDVDEVVFKVKKGCQVL